MKLPNVTVRFALAAAIAASSIPLHSAGSKHDSAQPNLNAVGVCEREAEKIVNQKPARIAGSIRAPKKTRNVSPKYPELPKGTVGSGIWIGETLVDASGKVSRVWPIRQVLLKPAFPAFNAAIVQAIEQWEFEPLRVDGKPTPFCMTVTTMINWG